MVPNRLLARAAQQSDSVLPGSYRAATVRERSPAGLFRHPVQPQPAAVKEF